MTRYALLFAVPLLVACNVEAKDPGDSRREVNIQAGENGQVSFDLPFAKGELKLPASVMRGGNVDIDGVHLMPGSKVTGFSVMAADKGSNVNVGFSAPRPPPEVVRYFSNEFERTGARSSVSDNRLSATTKRGSDVRIHVEPSGGGSKGMIAIRSKD